MESPLINDTSGNPGSSLHLWSTPSYNQSHSAAALRRCPGPSGSGPFGSGRYRSVTQERRRSPVLRSPVPVPGCRSSLSSSSSFRRAYFTFVGRCGRRMIRSFAFRRAGPIRRRRRGHKTKWPTIAAPTQATLVPLSGRSSAPGRA